MPSAGLGGSIHEIEFSSDCLTCHSFDIEAYPTDLSALFHVTQTSLLLGLGLQPTPASIQLQLCLQYSSMHNMSSSIIGNRNSTPESHSTSSLRPPSSRTIGSGHQLRASADMAAFSNSPSANRIRPSSDFYGQSTQSQGQGSAEDASDHLAQQWIDDINQYETTLEEMAAATLDQDFKDELSAIEQWFRVLSEAERTAALYALLQQTTQVQIRFFIQILQQMGKGHPMSGVLSPANFDKGESYRSHRV